MLIQIGSTLDKIHIWGLEFDTTACPAGKEFMLERYFLDIDFSQMLLIIVQNNQEPCAERTIPITLCNTHIAIIGQIKLYIEPVCRQIFAMKAEFPR